MKTTMTIIAGCMLVAAILYNRNSFVNENASFTKNAELRIKGDNGMYSSSEFLAFKRSKLVQRLYAQKGASDKVIFHKFVLVKKMERGQ